MLRLTKKDIKFLSELKIEVIRPDANRYHFTMVANFKIPDQTQKNKMVNSSIEVNIDPGPTGNCQLSSYKYINAMSSSLQSRTNTMQYIKDLKKSLIKAKDEKTKKQIKENIKMYEQNVELFRKRHFATLCLISYYITNISGKRIFLADVNDYNLKQVKEFLKYFTLKEPVLDFKKYISSNKSNMNVGIFYIDKEKLNKYHTDVNKALAKKI